MGTNLSAGRVVAREQHRGHRDRPLAWIGVAVGGPGTVADSADRRLPEVTVSGARRIDSARSRIRPRAIRIIRTVVAVVCRVAVLAAGALLIGRQIGVSSESAVTALALTPQVTVIAVVAEVILLLLRAWKTAILGAVVVLVGVALQLPAIIPSAHPSQAATITVLTANLRLGQADPAAVAALVKDHEVDLLAVQELTPQAADGLSAAGLDRELPYKLLAPREGGAGMGLWSRFPLRQKVVLNGFGFSPVQADITLDGRPMTIMSFHSKAPLYNRGTEQWTADLRSLAASMSETQSSLLVAGDFNATYDHRQFRALLVDGYTDAAQDAGAGWIPTYPADGPVGPVAGIDHVLLGRNLVGIDAQSLTLPGSDHLAVIARVALTEPAIE